MDYSKQIDHYAKALFSIWSEFKNKDDQNFFTDAAKTIYFSFKQNHQIINILSSSNITKKEKFEIIYNLFGEWKNPTTPYTYWLNFLLILVENNFFNHLLLIILEFFAKMDEYQNFLYIRIYSPYVLDKNVLSKIEKLFTLKTNKKVRYENFIDKNLIGGLRIMLGEEIYDYSIKGKLNKILWNITHNMENIS